jgi:hypothetical protein
MFFSDVCFAATHEYCKSCAGSPIQGAGAFLSPPRPFATSRVARNDHQERGAPRSARRMREEAEGQTLSSAVATSLSASSAGAFAAGTPRLGATLDTRGARGGVGMVTATKHARQENNSSLQAVVNSQSRSLKAWTCYSSWWMNTVDNLISSTLTT